MKEKCGSERPKVDRIFDLMLGPNSEMYRCFLDEGIFDDHNEFLKFLATFFLASAYQVSCNHLFDKKSRIDNARGSLYIVLVEMAKITDQAQEERVPTA